MLRYSETRRITIVVELFGKILRFVIVKHVELQYLLNCLVSESETQINKKVHEIS